MAVRTIAPEALAALEAGDLEALLEFHRAQFGGFVMEDDDSEDDEADDDDSDDDDSDDDDDEDDDAEYVAPTKAEWKKTQDALKKANSQARKFRLELKQAKNGGSKDGSKDVEKAVADTEAKWKPRLVNKAAKAALLAAGASKPDRLIKLIDHDELDIDDDGEVDGLDDAIEELKEDYPELFKTSDDDDDDKNKPRRRRRPGSPDTGTGKRPASKQKSSAERIAGGLAGASR